MKDTMTKKTKAMIDAKLGKEADGRPKSLVFSNVINFITKGLKRKPCGD